MSETRKDPTVGEWIEKAAIDVGDAIKDAAIAVGDFVKDNWRPILSAVLTAAAGLIAIAFLSENDNDVESDDDAQHLPQDVYRKLALFGGETKADEWAEMVENGEETIEHAINQANGLEAYAEEIKDRKDIDPGDWQKFEDGWRP